MGELRSIINIEPRYYAKAYRTPGVHPRDQWCGYVQYEMWRSPRALNIGEEHKINIIAPNDPYVFILATDDCYDTSKEAIAAIKAVPLIKFDASNLPPSN